MESNIIDMFAPGSENFLGRASLIKKCNSRSAGESVPFQLDISEKRRIMRYLLDSLINRTFSDLNLLNNDDNRSFMQKYEEILRIYYRNNRFNPELIILYQELVLEDGSQSCAKIQKAVERMKQQTVSLLRDQAYEDGILEKGSCLEQLILFSMEEIIKLYQVELIHCCRELIDSRCEDRFPSEEEMVTRFYKPIAEQLKGLVAS
jgi:hypothetical protein